MDLQRIAVTFFARDAEFDMAAMIPVFHDWIRRQALDGLMLLDVADYAHVAKGPGVVLICHEGHFSLDQTTGRLGLMYSNKRLATGSVRDRLRSCVNRAMAAIKLLETDSTLQGKLTFGHDEALIRIEDRLLAPNNAETFDVLRVDIEVVLRDVLGTDQIELQHVAKPKIGFTAMAHRRDRA